MQGFVYVYTNFGEVYAGMILEEYLLFPNHYIIIQRDNWRRYLELNQEEKSEEIINKLGWLLHKSVIVDIVKDSDDIPKPPPKHGSYSFNSEIDRSICFIVGAGASCHCAFGEEKEAFYDDPLRPPLGADLFNSGYKNLYEKYTGVKKSLPVISTGVDLEELFETEWKLINSSSNSEIMSRHINFQYYIRELLWKVSEQVISRYYKYNLYALLGYKLFKKHKLERSNNNKYQQFSFISFNQDFILDHFISEQFNLPIKSIENYVDFNENPICIYKPHGSANWGWKLNKEYIESDLLPTKLYDEKWSLHDVYTQLIGDGTLFGHIDWSTWGSERTFNPLNKGRFSIDKSKIEVVPSFSKLGQYFPSLLIPYRDKDEFTMPIKQVFQMKGMLRCVETLIIIGWKGNEAVFNYALKNNSQRIKKVIVVDPAPDAVKLNLNDSIHWDRVEYVHYNTFEDFVLKGFDEHLN